MQAFLGPSCRFTVTPLPSVIEIARLAAVPAKLIVPSPRFPCLLSGIGPFNGLRTQIRIPVTPDPNQFIDTHF